MSKYLNKNISYTFVFILFSVFNPSFAQELELSRNWGDILEEAKGQNISMYAWGGSADMNSYLSWVSMELKTKYDINFRHVKVARTADFVSQLLSQKAAGKNTSNIDLIWINGENFHTLKRNDLLLGGYKEILPNIKYLNPSFSELFQYDNGVEVEGLEVPWGIAQITFFYNPKNVNNPPKDWQEFKKWIHENPGRFTYPEPNLDFHGESFLEQALWYISKELNGGEFDTESILNGIPDDNPELFNKWKEEISSIKNYLWKEGTTYPNTESEMFGLMANQEVDIVFSFNPNRGVLAMKNGLLPEVTAYTWEYSLTNANFVAITKYSASYQAALVAVNFLVSPEAQARKADEDVLGGPSIVSIGTLPESEKAFFSEGGRKVSILGDIPLSEPNIEWTKKIKSTWLELN